MAVYRVTGPDGATYQVTAPDDATPEQVRARVQATARPKATAPNRQGIAQGADAILRGGLDMATFGLMDKAVAAADTLVPLSKIDDPRVKSVWEGDFLNNPVDALVGAFRNNLRVQQSVDRADEQQNPILRATGQVIGGVVGPVPGRGLIAKGAQVLAKGGRPAKAAAPVARIAAEGAVQGGLYGAGSGDSASVAERLRNARSGAGQGAAGSLVGAAGARGLARAVSPVVNPAVAQLAKRSITMTPGQRGGPVRRFAEEAMESVPFVGQAVRGAKARGIGQFNRALYDEGLAPIGVRTPSSVKPGRQMAEFAQEAVSNAYDEALSGIDAPPDEVFTRGIQTVVARATQLPGELGGTFKAVLDNEVIPLIAEKQTLDGATLQKISQILQKRASAADNSQSAIGDMLGDAFREMRSQFLDLAMRVHPERTKAFLAANDAEANLSRVYDAVSKAGGEGLTTPRSFQVSVRKKGYGTTAKRVARGDARMQELADSASEILPDRLPNSGTADRGAMIAGGTALLSGGAGTVNPLFALPAAGVTPYLPGVDRALQAVALRGQSDFARRLAEQIRQRTYLGGRGGVALTVGN